MGKEGPTKFHGSSVRVKQWRLERILEDMQLAAAKDWTFRQPRLWYDFSNDSAAAEKTTPGRSNSCTSLCHPRDVDSSLPSVAGLEHSSSREEWPQAVQPDQDENETLGTHKFAINLECRCLLRPRYVLMQVILR